MTSAEPNEVASEPLVNPFAAPVERAVAKRKTLSPNDRLNMSMGRFHMYALSQMTDDNEDDFDE